MRKLTFTGMNLQISVVKHINLLTFVTTDDNFRGTYVTPVLFLT